MPVISLTCPQCSAAVTPPPDRTQFFCQFCGATVVVDRSAADSVEESADGSADGSADESPEPLAVLRRPVDLSRFTIERDAARLRVRWNWSRWAGVGLGAFAAFWLTFITFWTVMAFSASWLFAAFSIPFWGVGLAIGYTALSLLVNHTDLLVEDGVLRIVHGPLPWSQPPVVEVDRVRQFFVEQKVKPTNKGSHTTYQLQALTTNGEPVTLLKGENEPDVPRAIERLLETHLGIEDRPVEGQL